MELIFLLGDVNTAKFSLDLLIRLSNTAKSLGVARSYFSEGSEELFEKLKASGSVEVETSKLSKEVDISKIQLSPCLIVCSIPIEFCSSNCRHVLRY